MTSIGIVGYGYVGRAMGELFPDAIAYDPFLPLETTQEDINACDVVFVCVPTPRGLNGAADLFAVFDVAAWCKAPLMVIKSTVPPGTTDKLNALFHERFVFCPEFTSPASPVTSLECWPYVIAGGPPEKTEAVLQLHQKALGASLSYWRTDAKTAEMVKYMNNAWLAAQVTFANEFYEIAQAVGADYRMARELWALDPRVSPAHTLVFPDDRGFGGPCLPKDVDAIIAAARQAGVNPRYLEGVRAANEMFRGAEVKGGR